MAMGEENESQLRALSMVANAVITAVKDGVPPTIVRETVEEAIADAGGA